jgi:thiol-disulfide isomerase/thioredoxin
MASKQIIASFDKDEFFKVLSSNPGLVIIKLGATWCKPCKVIAPVVNAFFATSPVNVICGDIDVDESIELYSLLKKNRLVNGIPVILCYKKGNTTIVPDDSVTGANPAELDNFFKRCGIHLLEISTREKMILTARK